MRILIRMPGCAKTYNAWQVFQQLTPYIDVAFNHSLQDGNSMRGQRGLQPGLQMWGEQIYPNSHNL